ncbi:MAG: diadenylate cyclase CdaA [Myxococcota bacterium]|nr:diadenylate cyclase CdaA [Myxococcales bacterium]
MIGYLWQLLVDFIEFIGTRFSWRDAIDIAIVAFAVYWLLLLIRGTRAVQILVGVIVLIALSLASQFFQFATTRWILDTFMGSAVLIIVVLFQHDIRRALARVGRFGFFLTPEHEESAMVEEVVRAAQILAQRRVGALMVIERESILSEQIEQGTRLDADVSKELLVSLFQTQSPLHDGAVILRDGRILSAGCILPLTLRQDLPDGVGTRHRAAVGVTEETDALVIVVSEETAGISIVLGGDMLRNLDGPHLRVVLQEILAGERKELPEEVDDVRRPLELAEAGGADRTSGSRA